MENFTKSKEYQEAFESYRQKIYKDILNPINVIITKSSSYFDNIFLFYDQDKVEDILQILKKEYKNDESELGLHLGFDEPTITTYTFMGQSYKTIWLWYDGETCLIPEEFIL